MNHPYHLVTNSNWPILLSFYLMNLMVMLITLMYMYKYYYYINI